MAATPKRAKATEAALRGLALSDEPAWMAAGEVLAKDYRPIDDMRASAAYRLATAQALLVKARHEMNGRGGASMRLTGQRPGEAVDA
jgi:xanthine dehydrogenase small subunit